MKNILVGCFLIMGLVITTSALMSQENPVSPILDAQEYELPSLEDSSSNHVVAWSSDGGVLAISGNRDIWLYDAETLEQTAQFEGHTASVVVLAWSPDSELLASAGRDLVVRIWDVTTGRIITALEEYESWITSVIWSPDGSTLATTSFDLDYTAPVPIDNIRLWNPLSGRLQNAFHITLSDDNPTVPSFASWSPDGQSIAVITPSAPVHVFDIDAGTLAFDFPVGAASLIAWSPNGSMFATNSGPTLFHSNGGWSSTFTGQIWDGVTGELIVALQGHTDDVVALAWSPDSRLLATSSRDKTTRIWDVSTWETLATLENGLTEPTHYLPTDYAYTLSWSPDSARLGSVGTDNLLRIWDLSSVLSKAER